jgi:hypothetical protein
LDVQQGERRRYRRLRDDHGRAKPDDGRRQGKHQRRAHQVRGRDDELAAGRDGVPPTPVEPAGKQPAEAGGGDDQRGRAGHPAADGEGAHRDRHDTEVQPDRQVEQGEEDEGRLQQWPSGAGTFGVPAGGRGRRRGRGADLDGQRASPAEDQDRGDDAGQRRVAGRAERGDQDRAEQEAGGVDHRFQGEGGGQLVISSAAQQIGPASRGQRAELRDDCPGAGGGDDRGGRGGGDKDACDGRAVGEEGERQDAGLAELVDQPGQLRADQRLGQGESGCGEAGRAVGARAGVQQPDQADTGHGDAGSADSGGEEKGGGTRGAQQRTVTSTGVGHKVSFIAARRDGPPGTAGA